MQLIQSMGFVHSSIMGGNHRHYHYSSPTQVSGSVYDNVKPMTYKYSLLVSLKVNLFAHICLTKICLVYMCLIQMNHAASEQHKVLSSHLEDVLTAW